VRASGAVLARLSGDARSRLQAYALRKASSCGCARSSEAGWPRRLELVLAERRGPTLDPEALGLSVGDALLDAGGGMLLEAARSQAQGLPAPKRA